MNETKYYCDFCKEEVEHKKMAKIAVSFYKPNDFSNTNSEYRSINSDSEYKNKLDICINCLKKFGVKPINKKLERPKDNKKINEWQEKTLKLVEDLFYQFYH